MSVADEISNVAQEHNIGCTTSIGYHDANLMFREGLKRHCDRQIDLLKRTGANSATSAMQKTGYNPISYTSKSWLKAIESLGKL